MRRGDWACARNRQRAFRGARSLAGNRIRQACFRQGGIGKHLIANLRDGLTQRAVEAIAGMHVAIGCVILVERGMPDIGSDDLTRGLEQGEREMDLTSGRITIHAE